MRQLLLDVATGAVAGTVATAPMSAVMLLAQRLGYIGKQAPEEVTEAVLDAVDMNRSEQAQNRLTVLSHLLFGAAAGAVFGLARRALPQTGRQVPAGVAFGLTVWATAYQGWVPALDIMPAADEDRRGRPQSMVLAHIVFGAALALLLDRVPVLSRAR